MRKFHWLVLALALLTACYMAGCASGFRPIRIDLPDAQRQSQPSHTVGEYEPISQEILSIDTLLYTRKLNGGISARISTAGAYIVVPTMNKRIFFLDPENGREANSLIAESSVGSAVVVAGELIYYAAESGGDVLTCFNLVNGKTTWQSKIVDPSGSPVLDGDEVFINSRTGKVLCLNRWTGEILWQHKEVSFIYTSPAVDSVRVIYGNDKGEVVCLDRKTGTPLWRHKAGAAITAQPMIGTSVFAASSDGLLYALEPTSGTLRWSFTTLGEIHGAPVESSGRLIFGSNDKTMYCLSPTDGGILWRYETDGIVQSSPLVITENIICANSAGSIYQFSLEGDLIKHQKVNGSIVSTPTIAFDRLFVTTKKRTVHCFGSSSAKRAS